PEPNFGTSFGEWSVMDLLRGMYTGADYINYIPEDYFESYISNVETHVKGKEGKLDRSKLTEWSRAVLALTPLGYDITDVAGYKFIDAHSVSPTNAITYNSNTEKISYTQGINAAIFGIIAMNTGDYELPDDNGDPSVNTMAKMIDFILESEITQEDGRVGGWALMVKITEPDSRGKALQG